jgi:hypothetical protein
LLQLLLQLKHRFSHCVKAEPRNECATIHSHGSEYPAVVIPS